MKAAFVFGLIVLAAMAVDTKMVRRQFSSDRTVQAMKELKRVKLGMEVPRNGSGEYTYQMQRPEGTRTFWAYVPTSYDGSKAYPLVFTFHGLGDDCYSFGHNTGMVDQAEHSNFILVYPCGFQGLLGTAWNAGTCCVSGIDDVGFVRAMIAFMQQNWKIDAARTFTSGFSNGAFMTEVLLCQVADLFAAGASISGIVEMLPGNDGGLAACDSAYASENPASLLHVHGDLDFVVPWTGDFLLGFPDVPTNFARWGQRNKCTGSPVNTFNSGPYSNQVYQTCSASATVELVKHEGGLHEWPSDSYFDTATYIWQFFSKIQHHNVSLVN